MNIVLFGLPGSGKGTQSDFLSKEYKNNHYHFLQSLGFHAVKREILVIVLDASVPLVGFPCKTDFAKDKDFFAALFAFLFQLALRLSLFVFDVRFLVLP